MEPMDEAGSRIDPTGPNHKGEIIRQLEKKFGSEEGPYKADLYRDDKASDRLATFSGTAQIRDGLTVLELSPDFFEDLAEHPSGDRFRRAKLPASS